MQKLLRASTGHQLIQSKAIRAGLPPRPPTRTLATPIHAVPEGDTTALCGAPAPVNDGEPWRPGSFGTCTTCTQLATTQGA